MSDVAAGHVSPDLRTPEGVCHQVASRLLAYPDDELFATLPLLAEAAAGLPARYRSPLSAPLAHLAETPAAVAQQAYVETFDLRRRCSLYLTYYAHGDTRNRGMALLAMKQAYRAAGVELSDEELPDHLAVVLEFAATVDPVSGRRLLLENRAGLELLGLSLRDARSPYAGVIAAVSATLPDLHGDDHEAIRRLVAEGPPGEDVGLEPFAPGGGPGGPGGPGGAGGPASNPAFFDLASLGVRRR